MVFFYLLFFILGSAVGSFLNVVCDRMIAGQSILGRSRCDHCRATLSTIDLVPVISFVGLGGRCRYCHRPISVQYPLVETVTGLAFVAAFYAQIAGGILDLATLLYYFFILSIFIVVATVDLKFSQIPTTLVFFASLVALFYDYFYLSSGDFVVWVAVAFLLALTFLAVAVLTFGRGMGLGDIPLVFLIGLFLGWPKALTAVFLAFLGGAIVAILLLALGKKKFGQTIPFGPFLVLAATVSLFWGQELLNWYISLF